MNTPVPNDSLIDAFTWRVHPARQRVGAAVLSLCVIAAMAWLAASLMNSIWWGLFAFLVPCLTLRRFFLPTEFRIDEQGIKATNLGSRKSLAWSQVRRFVHDAAGGYLSTRRMPSSLDLFRGMHLLFDGNREQVIETLQRFTQEHAERDRSAEVPEAPEPKVRSSGQNRQPVTAEDAACSG